MFPNYYFLNFSFFLFSIPLSVYSKLSILEGKKFVHVNIRVLESESDPKLKPTDGESVCDHIGHVYGLRPKSPRTRDFHRTSDFQIRSGKNQYFGSPEIPKNGDFDQNTHLGIYEPKATKFKSPLPLCFKSS